MISRRQFLTASSAAVATGGMASITAGCSTATAPTTAVPTRERSGELTSRYWPGARITWKAVLPESNPRALVVALHGFGLDGPKMIELLQPEQHVARTGLAFAAVSGGNYYWHRRRAGVDTGAMVVHDFVPLALTEAGLPASSRIAFLGLSMGGYGSLLLASELGATKVFGVVAESAALWTDPGSSAAGAFDDREDFLAHDVFRRGKQLADIPIRLDCGTSDPFVAANRAFAKVVPHAKATFDKGGHTADYWRSHYGRQLDWLAARVRA